MGSYKKEDCIMAKTLQEANREILEEIVKISRISMGANQIIYLVKNPWTDKIEYRICGGAPYKWGIITALRDYTMYDIINALFSDNLGYSITVGEDEAGALCIQMSAYDGD